MKAFYVFAWITAPDYYFTNVLYRKKKTCKIGNNTIIWKKIFAMGTKIVLKLSFEKLYIMIVTDVCAIVNARVIALEYRLFMWKMSKISDFV